MKTTIKTLRRKIEQIENTPARGRKFRNVMNFVNVKDLDAHEKILYNQIDEAQKELAGLLIRSGWKENK